MRYMLRIANNQLPRKTGHPVDSPTRIRKETIRQDILLHPPLPAILYGVSEVNIMQAWAEEVKEFQ